MNARLIATATAAPLLAMLAACQGNRHAPMPTVARVDLQRFMGDWFVIAHVPASVESEACNGVESYRLEDDGRTVATTYAFRDGGFDGPIEVLEPTGYVEDTDSNATWSMQFFWPFWAEYLITFLDDDYRETIVARTGRDYAWIMARTPVIDPDRYDELVGELRRQGYDPARMRRVPQRWPDPDHPASARLEQATRER
jgi:apolipoprotein D and lipocalin family protein